MDLVGGADKAQGFLGQAVDAYGNLVQQGGNAYTAYNNATGANGAAGSEAATAAFREAPGYAYSRDQALEGVMRSAAARGGLAGGNATADILKTATGLADAGYQTYVNNLKDGAGFYTTGVAGTANGLGARATTAMNEGTSLGALGTRYGEGAAGIYGAAAGQQVGFGQNVAGLQTNAAGQLVQNNNNLAQSQNQASANLIGLGKSAITGLAGYFA